MTIEQAKTISLPDFLSSLSYDAIRQQGRRLFYLSPFRKESYPSFIVDVNSNKWCDFGDNKKRGDILDFVTIYANLHDTHGALAWLEKHTNGVVSHTKRDAYIATARQQQATTEPHKVKDLNCDILLRYLFNRGIPSDVSRRYCKEIWYKNKGKTYFAVAFPNRSAGCELRNQYHKRCFGKKDITCISINKDHRTKECCVFEGFIDFLSYVVFYRANHAIAQKELCDCIVLNSVSIWDRALLDMAHYSKIHCYLDNDKAGHDTMQAIKAAYPHTAIDESQRYAQDNDLNDCLMRQLNLHELGKP